MSKIKKWQHDKEFDTRTLITNINIGDDTTRGESDSNPSPSINKSHSDTQKAVDLKDLSALQKKSSENKKTQIYEPRPLTPDDDIYEDILEQFAFAPTKPKYWFEEFGSYWSCSCGHINKGDICKSCGLERDLLRSLFILHKPAGEPGKLNSKLKKAKEQADKEDLIQEEKNKRLRNASNDDLNNIQPIEKADKPDETSHDAGIAEYAANDNNPLTYSAQKCTRKASCEEAPGGSQFLIREALSDENRMPAALATPDPSEPQRSAALPVSTSEAGEKSPASKKKRRQIISAVLIAILLVLVSAGGVFVYKYFAAPAMKYEDARQLQNDGKYLKAIKKYEELGSYKDSQNLIRECYIGIGDEYFAKHSFREAIDTYNHVLTLKDSDDIHDKIWQCYCGIGDEYLKNGSYEKALATYLDALDMKDSEKLRNKINDAKFAYVKANKSNGGSKFESYLAELVDISYPGTKAIHDEYYAWHIKITANSSESDFANDMDTISRKDTAYFHISVRGGEPGEKIAFFYEITWPTGAKQIYDIDNEWSDGSQITARFQYPMPLFGKEGELTFKLFDKSTQKLLGTDSITFRK